MGPFDNPSWYEPPSRPHDVGQQIHREPWWDGSLVYFPLYGAKRNIDMLSKLAGLEDQGAPYNWLDPNGRYLTAGAGQPHGGAMSVYALLDSQQLAPMSVLLPILAQPVAGQADLTVEGMLHSHWAQVVPKGETGGFVCITHWTFPGGVSLSRKEIEDRLLDLGSEATQSWIKGIRSKIIGA